MLGSGLACLMEPSLVQGNQSKLLGDREWGLVEESVEGSLFCVVTAPGLQLSVWWCTGTTVGQHGQWQGKRQRWSSENKEKAFGLLCIRLSPS